MIPGKCYCWPLKAEAFLSTAKTLISERSMAFHQKNNRIHRKWYRIMKSNRNLRNIFIPPSALIFRFSMMLRYDKWEKCVRWLLKIGLLGLEAVIQRFLWEIKNETFYQTNGNVCLIDSLVCTFSEAFSLGGKKNAFTCLETLRKAPLRERLVAVLMPPFSLTSC